MITVIDYGLGNLSSVSNALKKLDIPFQVSNDLKIMRNSTGLILPGVGAAGAGMRNLKELKLDQELIKMVKEGLPILGICLGMQLLFTFSEEDAAQCLDLVSGEVKLFKDTLKVPQIGWNQVAIKKDSKLLKGIPDESYFYFVNSYYCAPSKKDITSGESDYTLPFCSVLEDNNIYGVQFHPERSDDVGLKLLKNFWEAIC